MEASAPLLVAAGAAGIAAWVSTVAGFGTSALLLPILLLFLPPVEALVAAASVHLIVDFLKIRSAPHSMAWGFVAAAAIPSVIGALAGSWAIHRLLAVDLPPAALLLVSAAFLTASWGLTTFLTRCRRRANPAQTSATRYACACYAPVGLIAGVAGFVSAAGGAGNVILAPIATRSLPKGATFLATTGAVSALVNMGRLYGYLSGDTLPFVLATLPLAWWGALVVGAAVGFWCGKSASCSSRRAPARGVFSFLTLKKEYALAGLLALLLAEGSLLLALE